MQYLLMIYEDESVANAQSEEARNQVYAAYMKFGADLKASGAMLGGEALHPVASASTVRVRHGRATTTDGPFAETKEQLGGFYMIEVANLDEALKWAAKIPSSATGSIEVRPVMKFS